MGRTVNIGSRLSETSKSALWFLIHVALVILPLGNLLRFDIGTGVALLGLDVVVGLMFLVALPFWATEHAMRKRVFADRRFQLFAAFVAAGTLSLGLNAYLLGPLPSFVAGLYMARFVAYGSLIWSLGIFSHEKRQHMLQRLTWAGCATAFLGLIQYIVYPDLRNLYYLGWDEHLYRLFGTFFDPNFMGAFLTIILGMIYGMKLLYRRSPKLIVILSLVVTLSVVLTYSRSSYLMLLIAGIMYTVSLKSTQALRWLIILSVITIAILSVYRSSEGVDLFRTASIQARTSEYAQALDIVRDAPLLGVGFNAYRYAQLRHGYVDIDTWTDDHAGAGVPNSYLFVMATTGIVGFSIYLMWWVRILRDLVLAKRHVLAALVVGLGVHALFENSLFYPYIMFVMFVLLADACALGSAKRSVSRTYPTS